MTAWYRHRYHTLASHRLVFAIIPRLPRFVHPVAAVVTAALFFVLLPAERRAVARNVRTITGHGRWRATWAAYRVFYSFCDFIVSYCYVPRADHEELEAMLSDPERGARAIDACLSRGAGLVVWTAHIGNWEFASRLLELHGRPVNVARIVETGNAAESMLRDLMVNPNLRVVDLNDPLASIRLLHALRNNEIVAIQGDRIHRAEAGLAVSMFGRPARFPIGPFLLACASGAPLLPGIVLRTGWLRYRVVIGEPIAVTGIPSRQQSVQQALNEAVAFLERQLRGCCTQWLNFYDFWGPAADAAGSVDPAVADRAALGTH